MPGKQNYSLAITWALDHDPVERVHQALAAAAGEETAASTSGRMEADGTVMLERRRSLKIRRSASAQDATEVIQDALTQPLYSHCQRDKQSTADVGLRIVSQTITISCSIPGDVWSHVSGCLCAKLWARNSSDLTWCAIARDDGWWKDVW